MESSAPASKTRQPRRSRLPGHELNRPPDYFRAQRAGGGRAREEEEDSAAQVMAYHLFEKGNSAETAAMSTLESGNSTETATMPSSSPSGTTTPSSSPSGNDEPPPFYAPPSRGLSTANGITLQAIGITLGLGLCVSFLTILAFGIAVMARHTNIAPRCTSRHPNTIWRSRRDMSGNGSTAKKRREKKKDAPTSHENDPQDSKREYSRTTAGSTNHVSDNAGDRSTGQGTQSPLNSNISNETDDENDFDDSNTTSNKLYAHPQDRGNPFLGWIPWTLHLSYDRMLRGIPGTGTREGGMSGKLLAVNLDAIVLFRYHALCFRVTAVACFICIGIILPLNLTSCDDCNADLTNYGRTTIAKVVYSFDEQDSDGAAGGEGSIGVFSAFFWGNGNTASATRLYAVAFCTWYIAYYALKSVERDWRENLVLRRVYYLEADHYGERQSELAGTVYRPRRAGEADDGPEEGGEGASAGRHERRNPWIPNPEHRDTVPSIELYSVLVGGLPSLPDEVVNSRDMQTALGYSSRASVDWQTAVATTFFDHCVPNQPGFSSSVVAVTILPGAPELAKAWRKWYAAAATLRRLRFIRQVIDDKRYYAIDDVDEECGVEPSGPKVSPGTEANQSDYSHESEGDRTPSPKQVTFLDHGIASQQCEDTETGRRASQYQNAYGMDHDSPDRDYDLFSSLNYGPEQQAVYTREFAQGAAACCPNGCCEERVRRQPIDKLLEMEDATIVRLENAQYELQCAQMQAAVSTVDRGDKRVREPPEQVVGHSLNNLRENWEGVEPGLEVPPSDIIFRDSRNGQSFTIEVSPRTGTAGPEAIMEEEDEDSLDEIAGLTNGNSAPHKSFRPPIHRPASSLRMSSEGKFLFSYAMPEEVDPPDISKMPWKRSNSIYSTAISEGELTKSSNQWDQVNSILRTHIQHDPDGFIESERSRTNNQIASGVWEKPMFKSFMAAVKADVFTSMRKLFRWTKGKTRNVTSTLAKDSTYAVVTFSSRQAAVAARRCLADGRGVQKWLSVESVPVAPLADAAPCDIITCRGCCRPVTLNLNNNQLAIRRWIALASLAFIYVFYTIPITAAQSLVSPQKLEETLPNLHNWISETKYLSAEIMSGLVSALLYTCFFALCPVMFKSIANSGSRATSVQEAEKYALKYYWYFMLVTAFVFTGLADAAIYIWDRHSKMASLDFSNVEESIQVLLTNIAHQTPLTTAATWLNWIIVRTTMTLPLQYLLQVNSFIFQWVGWKCCARCVMGGGPGGPIPYRIYIDAGVVFLCVVALAPQSPLIAPVALLYYLFCVPLWRRNCIFMYRPKFDSGGERWPFLSDMLITSLFMGQFLLTLQMVLKDALGPAFIAACPSVPTYLFRSYLIKRFGRAYDDAGLLQTSLLDGWDNTIPTSVEGREEFRKFLVDAHKAAYIPVCIAGGATNILTAEPAVVMPSENDDMLGYADSPTNDNSAPPYSQDQSHITPSANGEPSDMEGRFSPNFSSQRGACMRRAMSYPANAPGSTKSERDLETSTPSTIWQKAQDQVDISTSDAVDPGCTQS